MLIILFYLTRKYSWPNLPRFQKYLGVHQEEGSCYIRWGLLHPVGERETSVELSVRCRSVLKVLLFFFFLSLIFFFFFLIPRVSEYGVFYTEKHGTVPLGSTSPPLSWKLFQREHFMLFPFIFPISVCACLWWGCWGHGEIHFPWQWYSFFCWLWARGQKTSGSGLGSHGFTGS